MSAPGIEAPRASAPGVFMAVLWRDLFVTGRELPVFLAQVILQAFFMLFVFGKVLSSLGYTRPGYAHLLFPGVVALAAVLTALQSTALPLVLKFSFTKEIEDRLLAPIPVALVAVEKMVFAAMRALVAAVFMFPIGVLILGSVPWRAAGAPEFVVVLILGTLVGAAMGLTMGTLGPPSRISPWVCVAALVLSLAIFSAIEIWGFIRRAID